MKLLRVLVLLAGVFLVSYSIYTVKVNTEEKRTQQVAVEPQVVQDEHLAAQPKKDTITIRDSIVNLAMELLEIPYVTAGTDRNGFDCSGFVYYTFGQFNIKVPRSSSAFSGFGTEVPIEEVRKGDILLFLSPTRNEIGHVGIVSKADGENSEFIHASSGKSMRVVITSLARKNYTRRFVKAISVF